MFVTLTNQHNNSWSDLVHSSYNNLLKTTIKEDRDLQKSLPANIFEGVVNNHHYGAYCNMVDKLAGHLKSEDYFKKAIDRWQINFLGKRQAPQEILKPNEEDFSEGDNDEDNGLEDDME